jgi:hypothetical protein
MKFRVETLDITEEERRAINWRSTGHRTPASRERCASFAEKAIRAAIAEALVPYREFMAVLETARNAEGRDEK